MKHILTSLLLATLALGAQAQGLVLGIIDSGYDYTHPAFRNGEGKLLITRVWEQGTDGTHPVAYDYGYEMTTAQDILAACADNDTQSHGTHVAARALQFAGKDEDTEVVLVSKGSTRLDEPRLRDAIQYIMDYAESQSKPCVINMSLGIHQGPHDGTSAFDRYIDSMVGPGRIIVGSAGNSGQSTCHLSTSELPLRTFVIYRSPDYTQGTIDLWGDEGMQYSIQLTAMQYVTGAVSSQSETVVVGQTAESDYTWAPTTGRLKGTFTIHTEVSPLNGKSHATISIEQTSAAMNYGLALTITPLNQGTVHLWSDDIYTALHSHDLEGFVNGDANYSLSELGGTADSIISVGALDERGQVATFCSRGPRVDGTIKPNTYAYGENIESALNSYDQYQANYPYTQTIEQDGRQYHMGLMSGTSMAAPMVTGIVGTWLRVNPRLSPTQAMALMPAQGCIDPSAGLTDGLRDIPASAAQDSERYYDLQGRPVLVPQHGIYLYKGTKIIK